MKILIAIDEQSRTLVLDEKMSAIVEEAAKHISSEPIEVIAYMIVDYMRKLEATENDMPGPNDTIH